MYLNRNILENPETSLFGYSFIYWLNKGCLTNLYFVYIRIVCKPSQPLPHHPFLSDYQKRKNQDLDSHSLEVTLSVWMKGQFITSEGTIGDVFSTFLLHMSLGKYLQDLSVVDKKPGITETNVGPKFPYLYLVKPSNFLWVFNIIRKRRVLFVRSLLTLNYSHHLDTFRIR